MSDIICAGTRLCVGGMLEEIYFARKILDAQLRDRGMGRRSPSLETLCVQITLVVDAWQLVPHDPDQMVLGNVMFRCFREYPRHVRMYLCSYLFAIFCEAFVTFFDRTQHLMLCICIMHVCSTVKFGKPDCFAGEIDKHILCWRHQYDFIPH